MKKNTL